MTKTSKIAGRIRRMVSKIPTGEEDIVARRE
jgi:hypothetical protein